ncbi:LptF/LptG family permease [Roseospira visakhapatnamensis]|uniref:Lipopolysaccharide export system permease protein n=1 Tax=Roseospira visakhapatnamensis TaxID=390880 RepID=A0A7W6WA27_9PROT|nr:LptF/LptG family permease [Roseospira visakhapatnamensis]MBB4266554.1 lipopolysaccharide export system permease protein [Roseospira visakhapatnamensis]
MRLITRYILNQLVIALVLGTAGLTALLWLLNSLRFFDAFINKGLSVGVFLELTLLLMPGFLTFFLPIALFGVILFVYHKLTLDRELMVLQSAGLGRWQLARPALGLATVLCATTFVLTLWIVPHLERAFNELQFRIRHEVSRLALTEGAFTEVTDTLTIYVRETTDRGDLRGLIIHDRGDPDLDVVITATRGALLYENDEARVLMVGGVRQERDRTTGLVDFLFFDSHSVGVAGGEKNPLARVPKSRERPTLELFTLTTEDRMLADLPLTFSEAGIRRMRMEGHQRIAKPLANIAFALLALGALLSGDFNRQGRNRRIIIAVAGVVTAQASMLGAGQLARTDLLYLPLLYLGPIATAGLGCVWLARYPRPARPRALQAGAEAA